MRQSPLAKLARDLLLAAAVFLVGFLVTLKVRFELLPAWRLGSFGSWRHGFDCSKVPPPAVKLGVNLVANPGLEGPCHWGGRPGVQKRNLRRDGAYSGRYYFSQQADGDYIRQKIDLAPLAGRIANDCYAVTFSARMRASGTPAIAMLTYPPDPLQRDYEKLAMVYGRTPEWTLAQETVDLPPAVTSLRVDLELGVPAGGRTGQGSGRADFDDVQVIVHERDRCPGPAGPAAAPTEPETVLVDLDEFHGHRGPGSRYAGYSPIKTRHSAALPEGLTPPDSGPGERAYGTLSFGPRAMAFLRVMDGERTRFWLDLNGNRDLSDEECFEALATRDQLIGKMTTTCALIIGHPSLKEDCEVSLYFLRKSPDSLWAAVDKQLFGRITLAGGKVDAAASFDFKTGDFTSRLMLDADGDGRFEETAYPHRAVSVNGRGFKLVPRWRTPGTPER